MMRARVPILLAASLLCSFASAPLGAEGPDRSKPPAPGPPAPLRLPETQKLHLSNGIPVFLVERHKLPLAEVLVVLRAGASGDPPGKSGLASLTAALLERGAGGRSALEISDVADFLGADVSAGADRDSTTVAINVPSVRLPDAVVLLSDLVRNPTFPEEELERVRDERLTDILQWRDEPDEIAATAFASAVYGAHPYAQRVEGSEKSLRSATREDVRRFHAAHYAPVSAAIVAVGDVNARDVLPLLERAFGSWKGAAGAAAVAPPPPAKQIRERRILLVDKPGAAQSEIRIGRVGPPRATPDYFPLLVTNTILGGSFTSRLNHNLRETKGYTYGAISRFVYGLSTGPFIALAAVQTDKTGPALAEFFRELEAIRAEVPPDELQRAKNYAALRYPAQFETDAQVAEHIRDQFVYALPDDYFNTYVARIQAVTAADVRRVAQEWIDPSGCVVVVVGDRSKIEAQIRALNLGPLRLASVDDVLGSAPAKARKR
jgi:zinc protease